MTSDNEKTNKVLIQSYESTIGEEVKKSYESVYGKKTLELAHTLRCIEQELSRNKPPPHILFQLIQGFFDAIKAPDPFLFHQDLARRFLEKTHTKNKIDSSTIDLLARELCNTCNNIGDKLFSITWIKGAKNSLDKEAQDQGAGEYVLNILEVTESVADKDCFNKKGNFIPLHVYLVFLEGLGTSGKKHAKKIKARGVGANSDFWFHALAGQEGAHFFHSSAFLGLTRILWEDKVKKRINFDKKYPASSVTQPTFNTLISLFGAKPEQKKDKQLITLVENFETIGKLEIPLIPNSLLKHIFKGMNKLNTVTGHRILRYCASLPLIQKLNGVNDLRVKEFEGGFPELGKVLHIGNQRQLNELRDILYTLKYLDVTNIKDSRITKGSLIDISKFKSEKTGREDGIILTILPTLVAYGEVDCKGCLLIPIATTAPPVFGIVSTQYHARLYYLQMSLLGEFSSKSKEYSLFNCIKITKKDWDRLLVKSNIPNKYKQKIIETWTQDCDDAPRVLNFVEKNHYRLGDTYSKTEKFLIDQGKHRIKQVKKGLASAKRRKKR